ncbi:hypothetical protein D3C80_2022240 [compost metagenome]
MGMPGDKNAAGQRIEIGLGRLQVLVQWVGPATVHQADAQLLGLKIKAFEPGQVLRGDDLRLIIQAAIGTVGARAARTPGQVPVMIAHH